MIVDVNAKKQIAPTTQQQQEFNYQHCWYPICFVQDLPANRPYSFSLYDEPFVLFRNKDEKLVCLTDRCPHRAAKLSDGQIIDGTIECLYHGWQFGTDGQCLHIPQLPTGAKIPLNACVRSLLVVEHQGMVWVWIGEPEAADEQCVPTLEQLNRQGMVCIDTTIDLPYDQDYLIENALDPAHVPISHDRTEINIKREQAQPLEMEIVSVSVEGIRAKYRKKGNSNGPWANVQFVAPYLVHYTFGNEQLGFVGGLAIYAIPLSQGRCRFLLRRYGTFFKWSFKLKPRWLEHLRQNKILEEDLPFIAKQQAYLQSSGKTPKQAYLPLKTCDLFVIEYRKWLDKFGSSLPYYQGYSTSKYASSSEENRQPPADRFSQHTQLCSSCSRAYQVTIQLKQTLIGVAIALAALAIVTDVSSSKIVLVSASLAAIVLANIAQKVKTKFERSYSRY